MTDKKTPPTYEYDLEGNHGYGWDIECCEPTRKEAIARKREYQENCPQGRYRIKRVKATN